ncbi:hypothetical protein [Streptomyces sp. MP131-18]|uniref:DUF6197 family protein n=1 Tax=Streptomyces sp. MP131-18 TaxID=1857892 RepID=UPI0009D27C4A|nr:hypothetical protein [Streptomyces sp. MP131-18]ONK09502.1 hypothetical protein STBA_02020 [Streptomyces sp. MP131-18]
MAEVYSTTRRPDPAEVRQLIRRAADAITTHGWTQGCWSTTDGRLDLQGALYLAAYGVPIEVGGRPESAVLAEASVAVRHRIGSPLPPHIEPWNDEPGRTRSEVLAVLTAAARAIAGGEGRG